MHCDSLASAMSMESARTRSERTSTMSHLECSGCARSEPDDRLVGVSGCCQATLLVRYDLESARERVTGSDASRLFTDEGSLWRYAALLPDAGPDGAVTLMEGDTPLLDVPHLAEKHGVRSLLLKDETRNPTGTFKARGMALAVTRARALGATHLRAPTAGNAGGALASYAACAGLQATVAMPRDAPLANKTEVRAAGARLIEVDGLIPDCARALDQDTQAKEAFDVSTLREPYRMEGKKTMGFELWEQLGQSWPDVVLFPTGGGMGILAIKKAHDELSALGLVDGPPPRLVAVQSEGCAPLANAFETGSETEVIVSDPRSVAPGIRVPTPKGGRLVLKDLRATDGAAIAVGEDALLAGMRTLAKETGILVSPEAGAGYAGIEVLREDGGLDAQDCVALFLTGTGLKHMELY